MDTDVFNMCFVSLAAFDLDSKTNQVSDKRCERPTLNDHTCPLHLCVLVSI